ncbi:cytochrome P450 [Bisporella sp. PMI_857]|nr:cytochrome P450 [Bisporella sp. PMI_857]
MENLNFSDLILLSVIAYFSFSYIRGLVAYCAETAWGEQQGCQPIKVKLPYRWPLAIDIVRRGFRAHWDKKLLQLFQDLYDGLGPNIEQTLLGGTGFVTIDPENIETMLSTKFNDYGFGPRRNAFFTLLGEGIFNQDGPPWKHSRALLRRQFIRMQYQDLTAFQEHADNLVNTLKAFSGTVDMQPLFFRYTLDTTTALIFGQSVNSLVNEGQDSFSTDFSEAADITSYRGRLGDLYWVYTPTRFSQACKAIKIYVDGYVQSAMKSLDQSKESSEDSSDQFVFIKELQDELRDPILVRDQLVSCLLAGRDTTACLMSWTFRLLVQYPEALNKLRKEITEVLGKEKNVSRAHIRAMPYLDCVLKEVLRLYPPVPANLRFATKTTIMPRGGGADGRSSVLIRKGWGVTYSPYLMHRRTELYGEDANVFRPERWEDGKLKAIGWGWLPFNDGPRVCLGKDMALMEASIGIARIIQAFPRINLPPGDDWDEPGTEKQALTLVLAPADGCKVQLRQ